MRVLLLSRLAVALMLFVSNVSSRSLAAVQGDITLKINPSRAQVNLGDYQVKRGQRMGVFKKSCRGPKLPVCQMDRVGGARVSRILNDKYAEIILDPGVHFSEGYVVERE